MITWSSPYIEHVPESPPRQPIDRRMRCSNYRLLENPVAPRLTMIVYQPNLYNKLWEDSGCTIRIRNTTISYPVIIFLSITEILEIRGENGKNIRAGII